MDQSLFRMESVPCLWWCGHLHALQDARKKVLPQLKVKLSDPKCPFSVLKWRPVVPDLFLSLPPTLAHPSHTSACFFMNI